MTRPAVVLLAEALAALPTEPDEIARVFAELGIRGRCWAGCNCPVANYLMAETGLEKVAVGRVQIVADDAELEMPLHIRSFAYRFDSGRYPDLIEATS